MMSKRKESRVQGSRGDDSVGLRRDQVMNFDYHHRAGVGRQGTEEEGRNTKRNLNRESDFQIKIVRIDYNRS